MRSAKIVTLLGLALALLLALSGSGLAREAGQLSGSPDGSQGRTLVQNSADPSGVLYNIPLNLPQGSRLSFLRIYYYDTSPIDSTAWITRYDGLGGFLDIVDVSSGGQAGYGYAVSSLIPGSDGAYDIIDNANYFYVLNWRPNVLGNRMQLCGLRLAYQLPTATGFETNFSYKFFAGTALRPRDRSPWRYGGVGCVFTPYQSFLPIEKK